jgi:predicted CxxxxCH...CXXCH cytochrome family protein
MVAGSGCFPAAGRRLTWHARLKPAKPRWETSSRFAAGCIFAESIRYAETFASPPAGIAGVQVIAPSRGLLPADSRVGVADPSEFASVELSANHPESAGPLRQTAETLAIAGCEVVLLGSIASGKYADCLLPILGHRLVFPSAFVGRGDMSPRRAAPPMFFPRRRIKLCSAPRCHSPGQTAGEVASHVSRRPGTRFPAAGLNENLNNPAKSRTLAMIASVLDSSGYSMMRRCPSEK